MQPPTTAPLCSAAFRATPPPCPASFPLHSELSVSSSILLPKEMADIHKAYLGSKLQSNHLRSKMLFWRYLSSQHFSNFVSSSRCPHVVSGNMWAESATLGTTIHHDNPWSAQSSKYFHLDPSCCWPFRNTTNEITDMCGVDISGKEGR